MYFRNAEAAFRSIKTKRNNPWQKNENSIGKNEGARASHLEMCLKIIANLKPKYITIIASTHRANYHGEPGRQPRMRIKARNCTLSSMEMLSHTWRISNQKLNSEILRSFCALRGIFSVISIAESSIFAMSAVKWH